ncbi:hypothetical protein M5689_005974 [Euphorbia peplus]|nr:hypothetical protein M5689_005974 [Euphorbia peplus]
MSTDYDRMLKEFLDKPIQPEPLPEYLSGGTRFFIAPNEITDWVDLAPRAPRKVLHLLRLTDMELMNIGIQFLIETKKGISARTVGKMLLLAYNLRDHRNQHVFSDISADLSYPGIEINLDELCCSPIVVETGEIPAILNRGLKINQLSNVFCYIAASYLRLYAKSAQNYSRVSLDLKERYGNFFPTVLPLENYHPILEAINAMKIILNLKEELRDTFYNLVHAGDQTKVGDSLKDCLYREHISYHGLETLLLFQRCMDMYKVDHIHLLKVLYYCGFEVITLSLVKVFENLFT